MDLPVLANISRISKLRFNALAGYCRQPSAYVYSDELAWFEHDSAPLLGILILDRVDGDFGGIVIGKDEIGCFRCVDVVGWHSSPEIGEMRLLEALRDWAKRPAEDRHQKDAHKPPLDVFKPIVSPGKMSDAFTRVLNAEGFSPARELIEAMMPYFEDVDGNFAEQFQSTGFDSRFWELYLFAVLTESGFTFDRTYAAPDFMCRGVLQDIFVEAVTVNPSRQGNIITEPAAPDDHVSLTEYFKHYMPMKWGSALVSKLRKEYWKLPHVNGNPDRVCNSGLSRSSRNDFHKFYADPISLRPGVQCLL